MANVLKLDGEDGHGGLRKCRMRFTTTKKPYADGIGPIGF